MVLNYVLQELYVTGWCFLRLLDTFSELKPLFQSPEVVVDLVPVALCAERAGQTADFAVNEKIQNMSTRSRRRNLKLGLLIKAVFLTSHLHYVAVWSSIEFVVWQKVRSILKLYLKGPLHW